VKNIITNTYRNHIYFPQNKKSCEFFENICVRINACRRDDCGGDEFGRDECGGDECAGMSGG